MKITTSSVDGGISCLTWPIEICFDWRPIGVTLKISPESCQQERNVAVKKKKKWMKRRRSYAMKLFIILRPCARHSGEPRCMVGPSMNDGCSAKLENHHKMVPWFLFEQKKKRRRNNWHHFPSHSITNTNTRRFSGSAHGLVWLTAKSKEFFS